MRLFIVSGTSGAGKSTALHALEDLGYYSIDNLPLSLLPAFVSELGTETESAAVGIDARNLSVNLDQFPALVDEISRSGIEISVLFLDTTDAELVRRFSETRRRHPMTHGDLTLQEAIAQERERLRPVRARADKVIDTSGYNIHQLRQNLQESVDDSPDKGLKIIIQSFGFKFGLPVETDFVFDVRCLPNPYWNPRLRTLTGRDNDVAEFMQGEPEVDELFRDISTFLERWLPRFGKSNRNYLTVGIGCTGGQHRSVYVAEQLGQSLKPGFPGLAVKHRELK